MINKNFWKNKRILITGYEGFLGSHLTKKLLSLGADIVGVDIKVRRKETILEEKDYEKLKIIKGSVTNYSLMKNILERYKIEIIFHLAAEALVGKCLKNPVKTFTTNIKGTWQVLEAARGLKRFISIIVASSDKAYGTQKKLPYKENMPLLGNHPYDVSKSCADLIAYTYFHTYSLPVVITRCGNIYGPGDFNFSRIVPDAIRCALYGKELLIRSDGRFVRDYVFVDDIVAGYILLAQQIEKKNLAGEAFNFSNETPISVIKLVKEIYKIIGKRPKYRILNEAKYEIKYQYLSSQKARKILKWRPKYSLEKGLKDTIKWYRSYFQKQ